MLERRPRTEAILDGAASRWGAVATTRKAGRFGGLGAAWSKLTGRGAGSYIALDVGSSSVKLLEVRGPGGSPEIVRAGMAPVPEGALQNNTVQDVVAVSEVIRRLVDGLGVTARQVVTAVPGPSVIIKKARLQLRPDEDLETLLMIEASNFIPESIDNVSLDYQVLNHEETEAEVLLVAVRKDILAGFTMAIADAGLEPSIVDVDYFALENMYELNYDSGPDDVVALINVGSRYSSINIVKGGVSTTTGDVPSGGGEITDTLVSSLGLSYDDAEQAQSGVSMGSEMDGKIRTVLDGGVAELADAIGQSLRFLERTASDEPLQNVYVAGGGSRMPGLVESLASRLERPVELVNPFGRVQINRSLDAVALDEMGPSLGVAVGLGTRRPGDA